VGAADADADAVSVAGASSVAMGGFAGGFTGAVSLAGGSVHFNGAMSVASTVTGGPKGKMLLADAEVVRTRDLGVSDARFVVRTHLGNILRAGDTVMGYDLANANYNDADAETTARGGKNRTKGTAGRAGKFELPDIVLVRKCYPRDRIRRKDDDGASRAASTAAGAAAAAAVEDVDMATSGDAAAASGAARRAAKARIWKLKRLDDVVPTTHSEFTRRGDEERAAADFESFLREIEDDPALRKTINLYKNKEVLASRSTAATVAGKAAGGRSGGDGGGTASGGAAGGAGVAARRGTGHRGASDDDGGDDDDDDDAEEHAGVEDGGDVGLEELLDDMALGDEDMEGTADAAAAAAVGGGAVPLRQVRGTASGADAVARALQGTTFAVPEVDEGDDGDDADGDDAGQLAAGGAGAARPAGRRAAARGVTFAAAKPAAADDDDADSL
jgi:hypothetical protein